MSNIRLIIWLSCFFGALQGAIPHGTHIKQHNATTTIESLSVGNSVLTCHPSSNCIQVAIQKKYIVPCKEVFVITCEKGTVRASADHLFYDPVKVAWVRAADLTPSNSLIDADLRVWKCTQVSKQETTDIFYELVLDEPHTFYISEHEILVHNFTGAEIGIVIAFGGGEVVLKGITAGLIILGCWLGVQHANKCERPVELDFKIRNPHLLAEVIKPEQEHTGKKPEDSKKEEPEQKSPGKTVEDITKEAKPIKGRRGPTTQHEKPGGYEEAEKDFEDLKPTGVKEITKGNSGKTGVLPDGRKVTVREKSDEGRITLEIHDDVTKQKIKIRYGNK